MGTILYAWVRMPDMVRFPLPYFSPDVRNDVALALVGSVTYC